MTADAWLPIGYELPDGAKCRAVLYEGTNWQIVETSGHGKALLADGELGKRWVSTGLVDVSTFSQFSFANRALWALSSSPSQTLGPVSDGKSPDTKGEALAFAVALKATRSVDKHSPLQDAIYVEKISRLLPTYSISSRADDDIVLGYWLTGGANVSAKSFRRLRHMLSWMGASHLKEVVEAAGFTVTEVIPAERTTRTPFHEGTALRTTDNEIASLKDRGDKSGTFRLPGRPELESFFNEHVVDIVQERERYKALGIDFPSAIVLHGPPGCGKTFAVERLVEFLGWPSFQIDAASVASPYIHETSKKVSTVFDNAMHNAPSVLVIDEMEAFLAEREMGAGQHRIEEVAEFLRRIPEATKNEVLIIAMTNRIEMIDSAILRRGRFDHVIKIGYGSEAEILALLIELLSSLPKTADVSPELLARGLAGRPLSDAAFVVREGARLAARSGKNHLDQESLLAALHAAPARQQESAERRRVGFV